MSEKVLRSSDDVLDGVDAATDLLALSAVGLNRRLAGMLAGLGRLHEAHYANEKRLFSSPVGADVAPCCPPPDGSSVMGQLQHAHWQADAVEECIKCLLTQAGRIGTKIG